MDLIQELVKSVGVNESQAKGGAGLLFKMAQSKLGGSEFQSLSKAIPNIGELIKSAPSGSSGGGLLGSIAGSLGGGQLGGLASMAGALSALKLNPQTLGKFVPVIQDFLKKQGNADVAGLIAKLMPGA